VVFLGHVISKEGMKVDLQKVKAVTKRLTLNNVIEIKNFSGLAGYYRVREGFVKNRLP